MGNDVFANGREISCKAADGKSICAFPDVCMTPPENPATPPGVPIPYPNTGMASDMTSGSKNVKISNKEVILKNKSYFKKSTGDEAGSAAKKGVVTSTNRGKVYFNSWSMDVKFEGENVVRHLDLTTHNHASQTGQTPPWPYSDRMEIIIWADNCDDEKIRIDTECNPWEEKTQCPPSDKVEAAKEHRDSFAIRTPERAMAQQVLDFAFEQYSNEIKEDPCHDALTCALVPYEKDGEKLCCPLVTPDHLIPASQFFSDCRGGTPRPGCSDYVDNMAPCMCAEGGKSTATHGLLGRARKTFMIDHGFDGNSTWAMEDAAECGGEAAHAVHGHCSAECIEEQLKKQHNRMNIDDSTPIGTTQENVRDLSGFSAEIGARTIS